MKWAIGFYALVFVLVSYLPISDSQFSNCGGIVEGSQGTIQSPNFPGPFPIPITCRWIIHAPEKSKIVIYFTQYYLRRSLFISEYDSYESPTSKKNENVLGEINTKDRITSLVAYRPYVTLSLIVTDGKNLNLRVEEFLGDVHGFNITWLVVPMEQPVQTDTCSVHECSFLGNCIASADYGNYSCECFEGFYGKNCEKGPHCDWEKGRNTCLNGGKCRYFLGSLVNICACPPGYDGAKCENRLDEEFNKGCAALKCSDHCEKNEEKGVLECGCDEGFSLGKDGKTCTEREQYRISLYMPVLNQTHLKEHLLEVLANMDRIRRLGTALLHLSGLTTAQDFNVDIVSTKQVTAHLYVDKRELKGAPGILMNLIRGDQFFGIAVKKKDIVVNSNPRMKLLSLENSDSGLALEGNLLTLSCIARGSKSLEFTWFKDGRPFNLSLTKRSAWKIQLPETIEEKLISVLNIDGVTIYDKGVFTCEINDFNRAINRSISVDVLEYPHVEATPLTISAIKGKTYTFRCFSPDEKKRSFEYRWIKNNRPIDDADEEKIEDLMPSGSRLLIRNAKSDSNYSCIVTNRAGTSSKTVFIFVKDANRSSQACASNTLQGIRWTKTFGSCFSLQKCPTDAVDFNPRGIGDGYTKRQCTCQGNRCSWHKPSYTGCQSVHLISLYDQLRKVQLGYQESHLTEVYKKLCEIAGQARGRMLAGDLDITAQNLVMILMTARDFPPLVAERFDSHVLIDFMSILLAETVNLTQDEKKEVHTGHRILQISEVLVELSDKQLITLDSVENSKINVSLLIIHARKKYIITKSSIFQKTEWKIEQFPANVHNDMFFLSSQGKNISIRTQKNHAAYHRMRRNELKQNKDNSGISKAGDRVFKVQYDQSLLQVLGINKRKPPENELFMSDVFSYVPLQHNWPKRRDYYLIEISHIPGMKRFAKQTKVIYCLSWERMNRDDNEGVWKQDSCFAILTDYNKTQCACPLPGHFTVVLVPGNATNVVTDSSASNLILIVACSVSISMTLMAIGSYLIAWRCLQIAKHSIHFNFILAVFGINIICLLCLLKSDTDLMCKVGTVLLHLFVVAAFTFLLLDGVKMCSEIYAESHPNTHDEFWKFIFIGWAIPIFSVACLLFMVSMVGFIKECHDWCWWPESHPHFYAVLIPGTILILAHISMLITCIVMIRKWNNQWRFALRKQTLFEIGRSAILLILLSIYVGTGMRTRHVNNMGSKVFFLVFDILLTTTILVLLCIMNKPVCQSVRNCRASQSNMSGFRAILQNGTYLENSRAEAERIHDYCSRVDSERYTHTHKQKLRILLSSNSSGGSSGPLSAAIAGPEPLKEKFINTHHNVRSRLKDRKTNNTDSGISEGTGSEKSSTPPNDGSEFQRADTPPFQRNCSQRRDRSSEKAKSSTTVKNKDINHGGSQANSYKMADKLKDIPKEMAGKSQEQIKTDCSHYANSFVLNENIRLIDRHHSQCASNEEETTLDSASSCLLSSHTESVEQS